MGESTASVAASIASEEKEREWKFTQWFRKSANDANTEGLAEDAFDISTVEFSQDGRFLATGDNSGNVVVLRNSPEQAQSRDELVRYVFHCEFQSHHPEFDFVASQPIPEKITDMKFGPLTNDSLYIFTTNNKHVKLWKITEQEPISYANFNLLNSGLQHVSHSQQGANVNMERLTMAEQVITDLKIPKVIRGERGQFPICKKWYPSNGHVTPLNHLCVLADSANFLSADLFKINLWDTFIQDSCYTIADLTPKDNAPAKEIVTTLDNHPDKAPIFLYGSNVGKMRLCDLRERALADRPARLFSTLRDDRATGNTKMNGTLQEHPQDNSLFDEVTSGISDAKFSKGGRFIMTRDYMTIKIWDAAYEKRPWETIYVHEYLRDKLFEMHQSELLWDGFKLGLSSKGDIVTGSYSNYFHLFELGEKKDVFVQASREPTAITPIRLHTKKRNVAYSHPRMVNQTLKKKKGFLGNLFSSSKKKVGGPERLPTVAQEDDYPHKLMFENLEFDKKILDCAWHPETDAVAITGQNSLFIYSK